MDRITKVNMIHQMVAELLPKLGEESWMGFWATDDEILCETEREAETIANLFDTLYGEGTVTTGYYDPVEDERNGETDEFTGLYYVNFA